MFEQCELQVKPKLFTSHTFRDVARVGQLERPPRAAGSQGSQKDYFKFKKFVFRLLNALQIKYILKRALIYSCNYFHVRKAVGTAMVMHTWRVVSCRVVACRVVSCRVVSCRVVSCRGVLLSPSGAYLSSYSFG